MKNNRLWIVLVRETFSIHCAAILSRAIGAGAGEGYDDGVRNEVCV